ncbi:MAG: uracil-DNA glycosylase [Aminobacterium sp.]|jgi:uracil-DNA glycosylase family 4|uniref:uracil-DNA glycosylase n=1 Tax=unclassified Aminobacterium TaxID=2685012 RepID=UPI001BD0CA3F|nr:MULTISPECIES: uracil-DNA glycosylase [unclassified Aminobacterium]MDD2207031.1 uracil-DNA glycosylase [Aminobacterium sp.]MDD3426722.1 uracil-DNA glycosylase [Aminobacterium sp.]MDD3708252.1 uracil-DNA glycosylase [Aminobacterium sp.]MDD4228966.1 uracil-DNA glycosylase [Aminobacterium sp.]MDD4551908.1 uracil-DNA glycosylase [Aminobacterium sp.]
MTEKECYIPTEEEIRQHQESAWQELLHQVASCSKCGLHQARTNAVLGEGSVHTSLMFVGEGPGADEDTQGRPFVGKAGQLLTKILKAANISRKDVYITNVVKCRPPQNRVPSIEEMMTCNTYLEAQIALIRPSIIVSLGNTPTKWFLKTTDGITSLRGRWFTWRGIHLMPMFHPSYLLRNDSRKKGSPKDLTWQDIRTVKEKLDLITSSQGGTI